MSKYHTIWIALFLITGKVFAFACSTDPKTECVETAATRNIDGVDVKLDCWRCRTIHEYSDPSDNNCKQLRDQNCSHVKAECRKRADGICAVQNATYSCPVERCDETGDVVCGKKPFCVGEACVVTAPTQNKNFDKATTYLAALEDAAQEVGKKQSRNVDEPFIFAGRSMECSRSITNAKNCCGSGRGWAQGIMGCADDEKELARAKEDGLVVEAGNGNNEYCHNKPLNLACTSYHRVYCVFDSKMARIVQNDGRKNQLGISFGYVGDESANPDCRGISITELSKLDFSKMDFGELAAEIENKAKEKLPKKEVLKQKVTSYTPEQLIEKNKQGKVVTTSMPEISETELKVADRLKGFYERVKK